MTRSSSSTARTKRGTTLAEVARVLSALNATIEGDAKTLVHGIHQDSRRVEAGDLFAARGGNKTSGVSFVPAAVERGAAALLVERGTASAAALPRIEVDDLRRAIALSAETVYGNPTRALDVVGVTGTN